MLVPSESLNLMACFITTMDFILRALVIVDFVALPSAEWAHIVTPERLSFHFLIEVFNELYKF
jgi:hypothetical protein